MRREILDKRRCQAGQALVGALVTMALLFAMAGGLVFAVSSLLDHQINTGNLYVADLGAQSAITAGGAYVAGHGLATGPSLCPAPGTAPILANGQITGVLCRQIDNIMPGTPAVARLAWTGTCSITPVTRAGGQHILLWFSAVGATSAYVDGTASGCSGGSSICAATGSPQPPVQLVQLALDCDLGGLGAPYLHISNRQAGSFRWARYAPPFQPAAGSPFPVGSRPWALASRDLNRDGIQDLVVVNHSSDSLSLLLGQGAGRFASAATIPAGGPDPVAVAVADVNGDGIPDLLVLTQDDQSVHILLGNGDGTFRQAPNAVVTPSSPVAMVSGDFNRDGKIDLAVVGGPVSNQLAIFLGNGDGTFTAAAGGLTTLAGRVAALVSADFNGDGKPDLAVSESSLNQIEVLPGLGNGTFGLPIRTSVGSGPAPIAVTDLQRRGILDLVVGNTGDGTLSVLLGTGSGSFVQAPGSPFFIGGMPSSVAVGDLNGDGVPDVAVTNSNGSNLTVLYGVGDGSLRSPQSLAVGAAPTAILAADLESNGILDLAIANSGSNNVTVLRGNRQLASVFMLGTPAPPGAAVQAEEGDVVVSADGRSTVLAFEGGI